MPLDLSEIENELIRGFLPVGVTQDSGNSSVQKSLVRYDYARLDDLKAAILGYTVIDDDDTLLRYLPWKNPEQPTQYAVRVDHQGYGYDNDRVDADDPTLPMQTSLKVKFWLLTIHYSTLPYNLGAASVAAGGPPARILGVTPNYLVANETGRYAVKDPRPGREYINPPSGTFYFEGSNTPISIPIPTILPFAELDTTLFQWPIAAYPKTAIDACIGKVNNDAVTLPSLPDGVTTYAAETLHLLWVRPQPTFDPYGNRTVNLSYGLRYRGSAGGATWNKFPTPSGTLARIQRGPGMGVAGLFDTANFNNLFVPDSWFT